MFNRFKLISVFLLCLIPIGIFSERINSLVSENKSNNIKAEGDANPLMNSSWNLEDIYIYNSNDEFTNLNTKILISLVEAFPNKKDIDWNDYKVYYGKYNENSLNYQVDFNNKNLDMKMLLYFSVVFENKVYYFDFRPTLDLFDNELVYFDNMDINNEKDKELIFEKLFKSTKWKYIALKEMEKLNIKSNDSNLILFNKLFLNKNVFDLIKKDSFDNYFIVKNEYSKIDYKEKTLMPKIKKDIKIKREKYLKLTSSKYIENNFDNYLIFKNKIPNGLKIREIKKYFVDVFKDINNEILNKDKNIYNYQFNIKSSYKDEINLDEEMTVGEYDHFLKVNGKEYLQFWIEVDRIDNQRTSLEIDDKPGMHFIFEREE